MNLQPNIRLNSGERRLEKVLFTLFSIFVLIVIVGLITQTKGLNWDRILTPLFFFTTGFFFILFGVNGIAKGQLVKKWTPYILYAWIRLITRLFIPAKNDSKADAWKITLGIPFLFMGIAFLTTGISYLLKHL